MGFIIGHVAKSFALRENPTTNLRNQEDVIAKIANGQYNSAEMNKVLDKDAKKAARDKKYGLASSSGRCKNVEEKSSSLSSSRKKKEVNDELKEIGNNAINSSTSSIKKQPLRKMGAKGKGSSKKELTASGKFRNAAGGSYFRKKLKNQMTSEFSDGR